MVWSETGLDFFRSDTRYALITVLWTFKTRRLTFYIWLRNTIEIIIFCRISIIAFRREIISIDFIIIWSTLNTIINCSSITWWAWNIAFFICVNIKIIIFIRICIIAFRREIISKDFVIICSTFCTIINCSSNTSRAWNITFFICVNIKIIIFFRICIITFRREIISINFANLFWELSFLIL